MKGEGEVEEAKERCKRAINRISTSTSINDSVRRTLLKLAVSEFHSLSRFTPLSSSSHLSVNIGHLEAVIHLLHHPLVSNVCRVCKPLSVAENLVVHVDVVCTLDKRPVWVLVSDRNPRSVSLHASSSGCAGNDGNKGFGFRVRHLLDAAKNAHVVMRPSSIVLFFSRGVVDSVYHNLVSEFGAKELGLELGFGYGDDGCHDVELVEGGEWVNVINSRSFTDARALIINVVGHRTINEEQTVSGSGHGVADHVLLERDGRQEGLHVYGPKKPMQLEDFSFQSLVSRLKSTTRTEAKKMQFIGGGGTDDAINFDTTALIALVSGISNGCTEKLLATPEIELKKRFKGNYEFVIEQVKSEMQSPIHGELACVISGKRGIICETVYAEFKELVSMCGGPNEKLRADLLLKSLVVVADNPSDRMKSLPTTRKMALKNKVVFGTGDRWHAPTLTANMAFVRAVSQIGMSLFTIEHRPRALTGD